MRIYFLFVRSNNSISNIHTHIWNFKSSLSFLLNFLAFLMFHLFPCFSVIFIFFSDSSLDFVDHLSRGIFFSILNLSRLFPFIVGCPKSSTPIVFTTIRLFLNFPPKTISPISRSISNLLTFALVAFFGFFLVPHAEVAAGTFKIEDVFVFGAGCILGSIIVELKAWILLENLPVALFF